MSNTKSFNAFSASTKIQENKKDLSGTPKNNENSDKYLTLTAFAKILIEKYGNISGNKLADQTRSVCAGFADYSKGLKTLEGIAIICEGEISVNNVYKTCAKKIIEVQFIKDNQNIKISDLFTNPKVYLSLKFKEDEDLCFTTKELEYAVINNDAVKSFITKDVNGKPSQVMFFNYTVVRPPPEEIEVSEAGTNAERLEKPVNIEDFEGEPIEEDSEKPAEEIKIPEKVVEETKKVETPEKKKKSKK